MHYMEDLKDLLCAEMEDYAEKGKKSGKMSMGDLDSIHKLTDTVKNILKIDMLEEETGYHAKEAFHLFDLYTTVAFCDEKIGIYYATDLVKTSQHLDEGEYLNVEAYELSELLSMVLSGKIQDSKTMAALMAFEHLRQSGKIGNK